LDLAFPTPDENGGKIMAGKIIKTSHDFAPNDFAQSCTLRRREMRLRLRLGARLRGEPKI
jgi:hypothetical protein